jgi:hypothetical protein
MEENDGWLLRKDLESRRAFLLYVTCTYPLMVPYMKGFHLTINRWRKGRDSEGWKYLSKEVQEEMEKGEYEDPAAPPEALVKVKAKPRLERCNVPALERLFKADEPPKRLIRSKQVAEFYNGFGDAKQEAKVYYGFGDASQDGFGFNMQEQRGDTIHYRFGQWRDGVSKKSSNYRELYNLVARLEELVAEGKLDGCKVFIFTDNTTAKAAFYKGDSSSKHLYELVLCLRELEMKGNLWLHVIHVAGTWMQAEGADGTSQGNHATGVMSGDSVLDYVPLHKGAIELEPGVRAWLTKVWDEERGGLKFLTPKDWFTHGATPRNCVWAPAPAAADAAAEQMAGRIHQHPGLCHVFVAPRLMTARWRRKVGKLSNFHLEIGAGSSVWTKARHEPLLMYVCLPLSRHRPWTL